MRITAQQIDPHVLQTLMAGLQGSFRNPQPTPAERRVQMAELGRFRPDFKPLRNWLIGGSVVATIAAASVFLFGIETAAAIGTAIGAWNGIFWSSFAVGMVQSTRASNSKANIVHSDLLAQWIPHMDLTRAERAYCETVALLAKPETRIDESTGNQILSDLNALMEQSRNLDTQREEIERVAGAGSLSALAAERDAIAARLAATTDSEARSDLEESLALCESRLENARHMTPALQRLDAQQERIVQTLASIQSRLARLESASATVAIPDAEEVRQTLSDLSRQTRSVEDAVQEVMAASQS